MSGAFQDKAVYGILGATGVIWSAGYLLWMYQRVFYGKVTHSINNSMGDMIGFDISHPCLTFDKWRAIALVNAKYDVVDVVETFF